MVGPLDAHGEAEIVALCERVGMPWEKAPQRDALQHPWDGRSLNLAHRTMHGTSDIVHDVAHWLVADPARRSDPSFGLDGMAYWFTPEPGEPDDTEEEALASMLGILLERALGLDWRHTWEFHNWNQEGWNGVRAAVLRLRAKGLVRGLTPACLLDSAGAHATPAPHLR